MTGLKRFFTAGATAVVLGGIMVAGSAQAGTITSGVLSSDKGGTAEFYSGSHDLASGALNHTFGDISSGFSGVNFKEITKFIVTLTMTGTVTDPAFELAMSLNGAYQGGVSILGTFIPVFSSTVAGTGAGTTELQFSFAPVNDNVTILSGVLTPITALGGTFSATPLATPVPIPAAAILFGSGLIGMLGMSKLARRRSEDESAV